MTSSSERTLGFLLAAILLVVGVVCYAGFSMEPPKEPVRMMFKSTAGSILFDHKTHASDSGYGVACDDCHHEQQEGTMSCTGEDCHTSESDVKRADALHTNCKGCHESGGGPVECAACHVMK